MPRPSSGGVKADPGLVGQFSDPFGPKHRWKGTKHAWQAPGRYHWDTTRHDLAPGNLGTVDGHDRPDRQAWVGQDHGGLVSLERHHLQGRGERIAAMAQPPGRVESEAAPVLLGVDHEHSTRPITKWMLLW
jgi:hypothetical protein